MKAIYKILVCLGALAFTHLASAQTDGSEVFVPISKYITQGNAENLSAWFADNLEISVAGSLTSSSKSQAKQIVKSFFDSHTPRSFEISHVAGRSNMKYALGTLNAGGETYNVTIFVSCKNDDYRIQQLKIEKIQ